MKVIEEIEKLELEIKRLRLLAKEEIENENLTKEERFELLKASNVTDGCIPSEEEAPIWWEYYLEYEPNRGAYIDYEDLYEEVCCKFYTGKYTKEEVIGEALSNKIFSYCNDW